jgi:hypothetical protein
MRLLGLFLRDTRNQSDIQTCLMSNNTQPLASLLDWETGYKSRLSLLTSCPSEDYCRGSYDHCKRHATRPGEEYSSGCYSYSHDYASINGRRIAGTRINLQLLD